MTEGVPYKKWLMCGRKKSFTTQSKANKTIKKFDYIKYRSYLCPHCHTWHLTKTNPIK